MLMASCRALIALLACLGVAPVAAQPGVPCAAPGDGVDSLTAQAEQLAGAGRRVAALLLLQRRVAEAPRDCHARTAMLGLLAALEAPAAAYELPANARLGGRPWLTRALSGVQPAAWLALEAGHDSNLNSANSASSIDLPLLNYRSLALNPVLVRRASGFAGIDGGAVVSRPLAAGMSVSATVQAAARYNANEATYLPHGYFGALAADKRWGDWRLEAEIVYLQRRLGRFRVIDRWQPGATWVMQPAPGLRVAVWLFAASNRYPLFNAVETREQGGGLRLAHDGSGLALGFSGGRERSTGPLKDLEIGRAHV